MFNVVFVFLILVSSVFFFFFFFNDPAPPEISPFPLPAALPIGMVALPGVGEARPAGRCRGFKKRPRHGLLARWPHQQPGPACGTLAGVNGAQARVQIVVAENDGEWGGGGGPRGPRHRHSPEAGGGRGGGGGGEKVEIS